jgi:hypothetical protein
LLTDEDPVLRQRLFQVLFQDGKFQWERLENLLDLAKAGGGVDLTDTAADVARAVLLDNELRRQLLMAFTEDDRLHFKEASKVLDLVRGEIDAPKMVAGSFANLPGLARALAVGWSDRVLAS